MTNNQLPSSFRDPASFVYIEENKIFRKIRSEYKNEMKHLMHSGLYDELIDKKYLIKHTLLKEELNNDLVIQPEEIEFISYPYEWSFEQIKDAALLTLKIQNIAINYNMSLKDASIYNVQFKEGKPIFIDTTSFEFYNEKPWKAYYQFCKHFLYPLWVLKYNSPALQGLYLAWLDGLDPQLTKNVLPFKSYFNLAVLLHLHLPLSFKSSKKVNEESKLFTKSKLKNLLKHLFTTIDKLKLPQQLSTWNKYYDKNITNPSYLEAKENIFVDYISSIKPGVVLDLGANDGHFSKLVKNANIIISTDFDAYVVNENYKNNKNENRTNILPLIIDVCNPSPGIGWNNEERMIFFGRKEFDTVIAIALIHHLVFTYNITLEMIAKKFSIAKKFLVIEFIPTSDEKVIQITKNKNIEHINYSEEIFETSFSSFFKIIKKQNISHSERILYLYERKD